MPERDLIQQLDRAVEAMLGGSPAEAGPEVTELVRIAGWLRGLPDEDFRARLRGDLLHAIRDSEKEKKMTTATGSWIRAGFTSLTPYLHVANAAAEIDFLKHVFSAEELGRFPSPDGSRIMHAEVRIGDSMVEMGEAQGKYPPMPTMFYLYVPDCDAVYQRALAAGATSISEPVDQPYGDRNGAVKDAFGNQWYISTHVKDVTS